MFYQLLPTNGNSGMGSKRGVCDSGEGPEEGFLGEGRVEAEEALYKWLGTPAVGVSRRWVDQVFTAGPP